MVSLILNKYIKLGKKYLNSIEIIKSNFNIIMKPLESIYNVTIYLGGSLGKKTLINEDYRIVIIFDNNTDKNTIDFEEEANKNLNTIIPDNFSFELQKESNIFYRYKYVIQFTSKYPYLIRIIQILKIWNENRKIRLSETILELLAIEATFRTNSPDPLEIEILKASFQTLHNALEGISIIPRDWQKYDGISASVSNLGIKIVDPGDPSNNLANNLSFQQDIQIRNECLRAISLISDNKVEKLLEEKEN
ncbi:MAG: hypothetical protein HeimC3_22220 [Candidatus Heimdallarchaeota archaeon LC_3]|nr:MAG: hypothetical protein HeimC3_22220 [Candidatus Heimdallarchaeota archaeon LC_3]